MPATAPLATDGIDESWDLARYAGWLRIAHHIPGRIRLKLAAEGQGSLNDVLADVKRFVATASTAPGIRAVSLNLLARSCLVEYDPKQIAPAAWTDLIDGTRSAEALALTHRLVGTDRHPA
ncbi:HMA2 domain-containing protein [Magnetospirillum molischianum]|uniref:Uncharacterized protein n=1 Tax=Magnetospirillum molischianum DSM 120 TaxID=1150626 RepID=H8FVQ3_MAGML|nr:hypothetical protein [Magnetospirillum molischianum]CCG42441.1 conserved hypothetical protein [Magnetospirillum molischianum DSM 120]